MTPHSGGYSGHPRDVLRQEIVRADRQVSLNCTAFISGEGMAWGGTEEGSAWVMYSHLCSDGKPVDC